MALEIVVRSFDFLKGASIQCQPYQKHKYVKVEPYSDISYASDIRDISLLQFCTYVGVN